MEDTGVSQAESGLVHEDLIPLCCRRRSAAPDPAELLSVHQSNEQLLRCLAAIEDGGGDVADEAHGPLAHEISRLDLKLDLLLEMTGRLLSRDVRIPDPVPVRISAAGLQWRAGGDVPSPGDAVVVELYLSRRLPAPVALYGRIRSVTPVDGSSRVDMDFGEVSEPVRNWLEKMIFRWHRRQVAHARKMQRGPGA